jgi:uncharacterized protein
MTHITSYTYSSETPGPHVVFLGGVHGNEPCGMSACRRVVELLEKNAITPIKGAITLVPVCNPRAAEAKTRFSERNLNRQFFPKENPPTYEDELINELAPILADADIMVDLHSYSRGGAPFALIGTGFKQEEIDLALASGTSYIIDGVDAAYGVANVKVDERECHGTKEWAHLHGALGMTLECGDHDSDETAEIAYRAVLNILQSYGFASVPNTIHQPLEPPSPVLVTLRKTYYMEAPGKLVKPWAQYEAVTGGTLMATYDDGKELRIDEGGILIMPDIRHTMKPGEEWFYVGEIVT